MFPEPQAQETSAQGRAANYAGRILESNVAMILDERGYTPLKEQQALGSITPYYVAQDRRFQSIYNGHFLKVDFFVWHPTKYKDGLVIECKLQSTPGSVDEKYPFTLLSLKNTGCAAILIVEGDGPKKGALEWISAQQQNNPWFRFYHGFHTFNRAVRKEGLL